MRVMQAATLVVLLCAPPAEAQSEPVTPVKVSAAEARDHLVKRTTPKICEEGLRLGGLNSAMFYQVTIDVHGHVIEAKHLSGASGLDNVSMEALRQWEYRPFEREGKAVAVQTTLGFSVQCGGPSDGSIVLSSGEAAGNILIKSYPVIHGHVGRGNHTYTYAALIDSDGKIAELYKLSGNEDIAAQVEETVRQWRYRPVLVNGKPVPVHTTITLTLDFGS